MPRNSSGIATPPAGTAAVSNTTIASVPYNNLTADVYNELTNSLPTTGVKAMGANLPMGGNRITGMADPTQSTDGATKNYVDVTTTPTGFGTRFVGGTTTGAANVQVLASTVPNTFTMAAGNRLTCKPGFNNSGAMTLQAGAAAAANVMKRTPTGPAALAGNEVIANQWANFISDGTNLILEELATLTSPTVVTPTLTLKQSATPTPTVSGDLQFGTTNKVLTIGDGAATQTFLPIPASTAAGDIEYYTATQTLARLPKGAASQVMQMNAGATAPQWATLPIVQRFKSLQQTITLGGSLTLAHGLGVQPELYAAYLQCVTAEGGYSAGMEVPIPVMQGGTNNYSATAIVPDATNMNVRMVNNSIWLLTFSGGAAFAITIANWKLVVKAWA